jgi:hypothetical protein
LAAEVTVARGGGVHTVSIASDKVYALREQQGIDCVDRIMRAAGLPAQTGSGKRRFGRGGLLTAAGAGRLQQQSAVPEPSEARVKDIRYIRTQELDCAWLPCSTCFHARSSDGGWGREGIVNCL